MVYQTPRLYDVYDREVTEVAGGDPGIWAVDADATWMTQVFLKTYPQRWVEIGIAEQNMVGVAAGIASMGKTVFVNTMATFLTLRAMEQIKVDVLYNHFNVKLASSFAGVVGGAFGPTHHGLEDIALCRSLPFMRVVVPSDEYEVRQSVRAAVADDKPIYIRLERDEPFSRPEYKFRLGKAAVISEGKDVSLVACGSMVAFAVQAAALLAKKGVDAGVINMHTIKPIDAEAILKAGKETGAIVTLEEGQIIGGLGSAVAEVIAENEASKPIRLHRLGFEDTLVDIIGDYRDILRRYKLMPDDIARNVGKFVKTLRR